MISWPGPKVTMGWVCSSWLLHSAAICPWMQHLTPASAQPSSILVSYRLTGLRMQTGLQGPVVLLSDTWLPQKVALPPLALVARALSSFSEIWAEENHNRYRALRLPTKLQNSGWQSTQRWVG